MNFARVGDRRQFQVLSTDSNEGILETLWLLTYIVAFLSYGGRYLFIFCHVVKKSFISSYTYVRKAGLIDDESSYKFFNSS